MGGFILPLNTNKNGKSKQLRGANNSGFYR